MKIYILEYVSELTHRYHPEGGAVVIAKDEAEALSIFAENNIPISAEEWADAKCYPLRGKHEPELFVFPDAGCC